MLKKSQSSLNVKEVVKFFSDILYIKEVISIEEHEAIMCCSCGNDLESVFENIMLDNYFGYGRGGDKWVTKKGVEIPY